MSEQEPREVMTDAEIDAVFASHWTTAETLQKLRRIGEQAKLANVPAVSVVPGAKVLEPLIDPGHPESSCEQCGRDNAVWFAPSPLWNKAVRDVNGPEIICPVCFIKLAKAAGIDPTAWKVAPESYDAAPSLAPPAAREAVDLERAAQLLEWCAESCRNYVKAADIEAWPYIPEMEEIAENLRAAPLAAVGKAPAAPEVDGEAAERIAILRRIAERGLRLAEAEQHSRFVDLFRHTLNELQPLLSLAPAAKEKK